MVLRGSLGLDLSEADLKAASARIARTIREYIEQEGSRLEDDKVPEFFFTHPEEEGSYKLDHDQFAELLQDYYRVRGVET